jgi:hypothetical protein
MSTATIEAFSEIRSDGREVVVGHAQEPAHERLESGLRLARAGSGEGRERASVPGFLHHDDGRVLDAAMVPVQARQLESRTSLNSAPELGRRRCPCRELAKLRGRALLLRER